MPNNRFLGLVISVVIVLTVACGNSVPTPTLDAEAAASSFSGTAAEATQVAEAATATPKPTPVGEGGKIRGCGTHRTGGARPGFRGKTGGWKTDFQYHSVPFTDIISGGPPRDGIPPLDNPRFVDVNMADEWLSDLEPVMSFELNGDVRAYPIQILMWHGVVNDVVGGVPVTVTFCPLCNSAIVFERTINGMVFDFGTSGNLRNSDLVMWDWQTESWWQQLTGEAIIYDWKNDPEDAAVNSEPRSTLEKGLDLLSPDLRAAAVLRDIQGLSTEEAAEALGISIASLKSRLHRARVILRQHLDEYALLSQLPAPEAPAEPA